MAAEKINTFKIYVGNIPEGSTSDDVKPIFEEFGTVVECGMYLGNKAFVHMEDDIEGRHAIGELQGKSLRGQVLVIEESKNLGAPRITVVKLFVKNVSPTVDARGLRNMFKRFGYVLEVELENGEGHVSLEATGDIGSAIKDMNGHVIDELAMLVEPGPVVPPPPEPTLSPSKKKFKSNSNYNGGNSRERFVRREEPRSWSAPNARQSDFDFHPNPFEVDYDCNPFEPNPFEFPPAQPFQHHIAPVDAPPERILRDPLAHNYGNSGSRFPGQRSNRGRGRAPLMMDLQGYQGQPPPARLLQHRPPRGMRGMGMGLPRGGTSYQTNHAGYGCEERVPRDGVFQRYQQEEEVFYEDEPLSTPAPHLRMSISGANAMPIGGGNETLVSRNPGRQPNTPSLYQISRR